jgi:Na+-translocating ferredoxin:NAD+ oxidoreductase RnfG subunit
MRKRTGRLFGGAVLAIATLPALPVVAAEYLSVETAQRELFPYAERFDEVTLTVTAEQKQIIAALAGPQPIHGRLHVWRATLGAQVLGHVFVDEVVGRQDLITYAVAVDAAGKLSTVEILTYRESHGGEIRNSAWRKQFAGRDSLSNLRFSTDIKNIAGATLSSEHVTQGVRWVVALWQTVLKKPPTQSRPLG